MPETDLCGGASGGASGGTGQSPPCTDCPDKMPFAPQDVFDIQWPENISAVTIRLPNGTTVPSAGIATFSGQRLRISFCSAPPCFNVEINGECTFLAFERVSCFVDCATEPSPEPPTPIPPPNPIPDTSGAYLTVEHWTTRTDGQSVGSNVVKNLSGTQEFTNAIYSGNMVPQVAGFFSPPVNISDGSFTTNANNATAVGGIAYHLQGQSIFTASITTAADKFLYWEIIGLPSNALCYNPNGICTNDPDPIEFVSGNIFTPNISIRIKATRQYYLKAWFNSSSWVLV